MATLERTIKSVLRKVGVKGYKHHQQLIFDFLMKKQVYVGILKERTRAVVGQRSSPAGYILYCNIFIIKKFKMK